MADGAGTASFYESLGQMIRCSSDDAVALVNGLNKNRWNDKFFTAYIKNLPPVSVMYKGNPSYGIYPPEKSLTVKDPRMKGEFSNVFTNTEDIFVYKVLVPSGYLKHSLPYLYTSFKEIVIQSLLQSDPTHGKFICKLHGVFVAAPGQVILKLEGLPMSYENHLLTKVEMRYTRETMVKNSIKIKDDLIRLFTILKHFRDKYEYQHYDLHFNNLMVDASGEFKLIDFGYESYAKIDDVVVGRTGIGEPDIYRFIRTMRPKLGPLPITGEFKALLGRMEEESQDPKIPLDKFIDDLSKYIAAGGRRKRKTRRLRKQDV
jgi:hypothetical protein